MDTMGSSTDSRTAAANEAPRKLRRQQQPRLSDICALCGHTYESSSFDSKSCWFMRCGWCGAKWGEWDFLHDLGKRDGSILLRTCHTSKRFELSDLLMYVAVGGNGPGWYYLGTRHRVQLSCECRHFFSTDMMRFNRSRLRRRWRDIVAREQAVAKDREAGCAAAVPTCADGET
jgi:hypothetical protein